MADCEHLATTMAYFDGALAPDREAAALEHLATCAICQGGLGDAVVIDAALSTAARPAAVAPRRRKWPLVAMVAGGLAAAAAIAYVVRPRSEHTEVAIVLPSDRAIEARFSGERFGKHRPYSALRGDAAVESIALADLAKLEKSRETPDLIAALAATGNVARAKQIAAGLPADANGESDRAAVALASKDVEGALDHAARATALDPHLAAGWWNLALAARSQGLLRVARGAFEKVAARGEPGWAAEATAQIAGIDRDLAPELEHAQFTARAKTMIEGGAVIDVADVRRFPAHARIHTLDAIRVASGARLDELRPVAKELDAISGTPTMTGYIDRAAKVDPKLRAGFADRYRAVIGRTASAADIVKLVEDLAKAGTGVDDIRAGAIIAGSLVDARLAELAKIAAPWKDPWIDLVVERNRILNAFPDGDLRAIPALIATMTSCSTDAWSMRCGQVAQELASQLANVGRTQEAERWATRAVELYRRGNAPQYVQTALALLGDIHRNRGRTALAGAELQEVILATDRCALKRHTQIALAQVELSRNDWAGVRATLPAPVPEKGCETTFEIQAIGTAVDLARATKSPDDATRANAWIAAAAQLADPNKEAIALVAAARVARGADSGTTAKVRTWLEVHPPSPTAPWPTAIRTWGYSTLIADEGARGDWAKVLAIAETEYPHAARANCTLVLSFDDTELTVAARTPSGVAGAHRALALTELDSATLVPAAIATQLASCDEVAVTARPPLHGRPDLLPPAVKWWFAGDAPAHARVAGTPRAIEVTGPRPPDDSLPPLPAPGPSSSKFDASLSGPDATPARVLAAIADATYAEIHAHGVASVSADDAAFLALSPDPDGTYALRASAVRTAKLAKAPIVVLAACRAAAVAPYLRERWSLPDAWLIAGAHAVVAVDVPIPDASARKVFDELHRRIDAGEPVHAAVAAIRAAAPPGDWSRRLMVFR